MAHLTVVYMEMRVSIVVTSKTILPGTISGFTRKLIHDTITNKVLGRYVWSMYGGSFLFMSIFNDIEEKLAGNRNTIIDVLCTTTIKYCSKIYVVEITQK